MLRSIFRGLKDLVYPNSCLICKQAMPAERQQPACPACWEGIQKNLPPFCSRCGRHLEPEAIQKNSCPHCAGAAGNFYFDRAFSPCVYSGAVKKLIHEFKYGAKDYLRRPLGLLMQGFIRDYQLPVEHLDFITPVPLHPSRMRQREFNQAQALAEEISRGLDCPGLYRDCLLRVKSTKPQAGLGFTQRWQNMENCFTAKDPGALKNSAVLLVDDVLTTGATASLAAKCLKDAGSDKVILLTLAS